MQKFSKYITTRKMPILELEDKNNPLVIVKKENNSISYNQRGQQTEAVAVRTSKPLLSTQICAYFQIQVKSSHRSSQVSIGLINKDCAMKRHPGESNMSFGYRNNGSVFLNRIKKLSSENFGNGFRVGVGVNYVKKQFFITNEGQFKKAIPYEEEALWTAFYPCASVKKDKDVVIFHFDEDNFKFPLKSYLQKSIKQCESIIKTETLNQDLTYKLVGQYLQFHGYSNSHQVFSEHYSSQQYKFKAHPFLANQKELIHENEDKQAIMEEGNAEKHEMKDQQQEPEKQVVVQRQRSMSQYWNIMVQSQLNDDFEEEELLFRRKSSLISLGQMRRKSKINQKTEEQEDEVCVEHLKFLKQTRIQVINLIRNREVEEAESLLKKHLPEIFQSYSHISNYFLLHKLFKILFQNGTVDAVKYMRQNKSLFVSFKKEIFPFYSKKQKAITMIPFQDIAGLICLRQSERNGQLGADQFFAFAYVLNQLILTFFGLFSESKLQLMINHGICLNKRAELHNVGGVIFNF